MFKLNELNESLRALFSTIESKQLNRKWLDTALSEPQTQTTYNHLAFLLAIAGYDAEVDRLVEKGANVAAALHGYVQVRNVGRIEALLTPDVDINYVHSRHNYIYGENACHVDLMSLIMRALFDIGYERTNDPERLRMVELLLAQKPNLDLGVDHTGSTGGRPLIWAAGRTDGYLQRFLAAGANPSIAEKHGHTPLKTTAWMDLPGNCKALLDAGAATESADSSSETALLTAAHARSRDVIKLLLDNKANAKATNYSGKTALMLAMFPDHRMSSKPLGDITQLLIESGVEVNAVDSFGASALTLAVESYSVPAADLEVLLEAGADVNHYTRSGETALSKIVFKSVTVEHMGIIRLLLRAGADPFQTFEKTTLLDKLIDSPTLVEQLRFVLKEIFEGQAPAATFEKMQGCMERLAKVNPTLYAEFESDWLVTSGFYSKLLSGNIEGLAEVVTIRADASASSSSTSTSDGDHLKPNINTSRGSVPQLLLDMYNKQVLLGDTAKPKLQLLEQVTSKLIQSFDLNPYRTSRVQYTYLYETAYSVVSSLYNFFTHASRAVGYATSSVDNNPKDRIPDLPENHGLRKILLAAPSHLAIQKLLTSGTIQQAERIMHGGCQLDAGIAIRDYRSEKETIITTEQYRLLVNKEVHFIVELLNASNKHLPLVELTRLNKLQVVDSVPANAETLTAAEGEQARLFLAQLQQVTRAVVSENASFANAFQPESEELSKQVTTFEVRK